MSWLMVKYGVMACLKVMVANVPTNKRKTKKNRHKI